MNKLDDLIMDVFMQAEIKVISPKQFLDGIKQVLIDNLPEIDELSPTAEAIDKDRNIGEHQYSRKVKELLERH